MPAAVAIVDEAEVSALVDRACDGEGDAFASLYLSFHDRVYRYLVKLLGDRAAAEDLAQASFVKALEALPTYDPSRGSFRSWLFTIVHNQATDHLRKHGRVDVMEPAEVQSRQEAQHVRALSVATHLDSSGGVAALIKQLPERQRRVIYLRYVFGMEASDIGDVVGASPAAVRQSQKRALDALAMQLAA